ncbi:DUF2889 domain-containing protein [Macromonas nakdongensis]|uniref:DUF2889 domain-containing protein n=1 Tax=Macromonas nakdongensis TaxID=1843082 RepID=UPI001E6556C7|nr:DUF2889 domain-containing protein [Macromonas nakdongensis]
MHTRRVEYRGFQRDDGLWDIEGELHDSKPHAFEIEGEGRWAPDEAIHHMLIRVTVDHTLVVRDVAVAMDSHPHAPCPQAMAPMQRMIGTRMGGGWRQAIERHLGGIQGCTHLRELLYNMATAAFQTLSEVAFATPSDGSKPPVHLGKCLAWDFDGPVTEKVYPMFFRWRPPSPDAAHEPLEQAADRAHPVADAR